MNAETIADAFPPAFYDHLVDACAYALAAYPEEKARLHRAARLILDGSVRRGDDGTYTVLSQTRPGTVYTVNSRCTCKAFQFADNARCVHRFSVALYKRALAQSAHWETTHSETLRDERAAAGDVVAQVCSPVHMHAAALCGHAGPTSPAALELPSRVRCANRQD